MKLKKDWLLVISVSTLLIISGIYLHFHAPNINPKYQTAAERDKYVRFDMEVYDEIAKVYWQKSKDSDLANLFMLSVNKAANTNLSLSTSTRAGTAELLSKIFSEATSTESKKQLAINTVIIALYNIVPVGRDQLLSQKQETELRQNVSNINPSKDLYGDLGLAKGADINEVDQAYKQKTSELKNATTSEAKAELEKVKYSHSVLADRDSKSFYDEAKIEPTLGKKIIGSTLYLDLSKISPTTLIELARAVDNASTTKGLNSLILDLRGNIGGSLDFLPNFFGLFVGKDQYAFDFYQQGNYIPERTVQSKFPELDRFKEIVILTDNMTQSTAELTTATFKKFHMATIVGQTTRGWGTIENTYPINTEIDPTEKYSLLLVNSITLREDNQPIEGRGVDPDVNIRNPNWKNELSKFIKSQSLIEAVKSQFK